MSNRPHPVREVLVSIVSHGHGAMVADLLRDLALPGNAEYIRVVLTLNVPEDVDFRLNQLPFPVEVLRNEQPLAFSANHNRAFKLGMKQEAAAFYCVLNPDLRIPAGAMPALRACFDEAGTVGLVAPVVVSPEGAVENSVRPLPTPVEIALKVWARLLGRKCISEPQASEWYWLAGMFMLFDAAAYRVVGGFDERYFLYYEDVDICCRLGLAGYGIRRCQSVKVIHDARRDSHRRPWYFFMHLTSAWRFFRSPTYFRCRGMTRGRE
ncbi:MAG: glycosyl transferase [Hydrogenophilales bacterium CG15_BIG_FIL_POST_REV_8_21_14_020_62_31]|nr:MAG: glycosyl transferase [Hydrogenophilales bacterium CG15_BIG_FIL_POST_REV_8_21_14_020_62_31]